MPNTFFPASAFVHRHNLDGTWDSICTSCFLTVATERAEGGLAVHERRHNCDSLMKARMRAGFPEQLRRAGALLEGYRASAYVEAEEDPN